MSDTYRTLRPAQAHDDEVALLHAAVGVVGVLAALWPAARAARTSPLAVIAEG